MARHWFGGGLADWTFTSVDGVDGQDDIPQLVGGATVTFWNLPAGGTQHTDLIVDEEEASEVVTSDGSDGREVGSIPAFQGPDDVWWMWADGGLAGRYVIVAWDGGDFVADVIEQAAANAAGITSHVGATNPHATRVRDLDDADTDATAAASDGQVFAYHAGSGLWRPVSIAGVSGVVTLDTVQTITRQKVHETTVDEPILVLRVMAGQDADLLVAENFLGQRTGYLNENGEIRGIASGPNTVAVRIKQRNSGQTANLTEWTDISNNVLARITSHGRVLGVNTMHAPWLLSVSGSQVEVGQGVARIYNDTGGILIVRSVRASAGVAPVGDDIVIDVNKNGVSLLTTEIVIPDGLHTSGKITGIAVSTINPGEYVTVDIDQLGSSVEGDHIVVQIDVA